eukprot:sb/3466522/
MPDALTPISYSTSLAMWQRLRTHICLLVAVVLVALVEPSLASTEEPWVDVVKDNFLDWDPARQRLEVKTSSTPVISNTDYIDIDFYYDSEDQADKITIVLSSPVVITSEHCTIPSLTTSICTNENVWKFEKSDVTLAISCGDTVAHHIEFGTESDCLNYWTSPAVTQVKFQTYDSASQEYRFVDVGGSVKTCPVFTIANAVGSPWMNTAAGTIINISCDTGYIRTGEEYVTCLDDGDWSSSDSETNCIANPDPTCPIFTISNAIDSPWIDTAATTTITIACDVGYILTGEKDVTCLDTAQWSSTEDQSSCVEKPGKCGLVSFCFIVAKVIRGTLVT